MRELFGCCADCYTPLQNFLNCQSPSFFNMSYGGIIALGSLILTGVIVGIINKIKTGENGFF